MEQHSSNCYITSVSEGDIKTENRHTDDKNTTAGPHDEPNESTENKELDKTKANNQNTKTIIISNKHARNKATQKHSKIITIGNRHYQDNEGRKNENKKEKPDTKEGKENSKQQKRDSKRNYTNENGPKISMTILG